MSRSDHPSKRRVTYLDAWGAIFSPRWPLIQWVCEMTDAEARDAMRAMGLIGDQPVDPPADSGPTLFDLDADDNAPADSTGAKEMEVV
ncbi:MAG: hypothetical protein GC159_17465 [Phycisphaera sp.]|nr:hypothetical protein [Phycisphaera sp.]